MVYAIFAIYADEYFDNCYKENCCSKIQIIMTLTVPDKANIKRKRQG